MRSDVDSEEVVVWLEVVEDDSAELDDGALVEGTLTEDEAALVDEPDSVLADVVDSGEVFFFGFDFFFEVGETGGELVVGALVIELGALVDSSAVVAGTSLLMEVAELVEGGVEPGLFVIVLPLFFEPSWSPPV